MKKFIKRFLIALTVLVVLLLIINNRTRTIKWVQITPHLWSKSMTVKAPWQDEETFYRQNWWLLWKWYYENWEPKMLCNFVIENKAITQQWECNMYYENWQVSAEWYYNQWKEDWTRKRYDEKWNLIMEWKYNLWDPIIPWTWYDEKWHSYQIDNIQDYLIS